MYFRTTIVVAAALALCADLTDVNRYRTPLLAGTPDFGSSPNSRSMPEVYLSVTQQPSGKQAPLQPQSRLEIVRYVSGEFAKVRKPIPSGKKGFKIEVGKQVDDNDLRNALHSQGPAANPGDTVQVGMGGGGGMDPMPVSSTQQKPNGGTLILDFGRPVPDMSADDLMTDLQAFLDFSKEHSGAVNWIDTLPPQFKQAITDHEALVGMNHEMVLAALGRPEHKVRERDPDGTETEDWIYGTPPARTTFVTFNGEKVIRVKEFD
jgi:hypothetical protein